MKIVCKPVKSKGMLKGLSNKYFYDNKYGRVYLSKDVQEEMKCEYLDYSHIENRNSNANGTGNIVINIGDE